MVKNKNGITLVALVITIIVLLIMAGVSIALVVGDNGIISRSQEAKAGSIVAEETEQVDLAYSSAFTKNLGDAVSAEDLQEELDESVGNGKTTVTVDGNSLKVLFNETGHSYNVKNGRVGNETGGETGLSDAEKLKQFYLANYYNYDGDIGPYVWDTPYEVDGKEVWCVGGNDDNVNPVIYVLYNGSIFQVEFDWDNVPHLVTDVQFVITAEPLVVFHVDGENVLITPSTPENPVHGWYYGPTTAADEYYYLNDVDEPDHDRPFIGGYMTNDAGRLTYYDATGEPVRVSYDGDVSGSE